MRSLMMFAATRITGTRRRMQALEARLFNSSHAPELDVAYAAFARHSQISSGRQPRKGRDLWRLLVAAHPKSIIELGSGTTSAVFSLWASRNDARYVAYEHHEGWARVAQQCLREADLVGETLPVRVVPSRTASGGESTGFTQPVPKDIEFVYVDGPPCVLDSGRKVPNDDVVRLFDRGGRPRTIVVDGRFETVDLIRRHPIGVAYAFRPSYDYGIHKGLWWGTLLGGEHSVFSRSV